MPRKTPFRLAALLRLRRREDEDARTALGAATAAQRDAEASLERRYAELTASVIPKSANPQAFAAAAYARTSIRSALDEATALVQTRATARDEAETAWRATHMRVKALENLETQHATAQKKALAKAEENANSDRSSAAYAAGLAAGADEEN